MRTLHANWVWVALVCSGLVGLWGVGLSILRRPANRWFDIGVWVAIGAMLVQIALGFLTYGQGLRPEGDFHLFYGYLVLFTFAFAYIFRDRISQRPALIWGILLLFTMGLAIRAWSNVAG